MHRLILGIETSCDETAVAVFDAQKKRMLSSCLFSQIDEHALYGGVVPEIASRSQLEKINEITQEALLQAKTSLNNIDVIAVTNKPGLAGSLLVGVSFAKALAWSLNKPLIGVNHLEGHIFSSFLCQDGSVNDELQFPFIAQSASGGHTALYLVHDFGKYEVIGETIDDAAGELFDKVAKMLGHGYPGGATIERLAKETKFKDFFNYPRTKKSKHEIFYSFSGLKTAVLYDLANKGMYDLKQGPILANITEEIKQQVSSSLLVCVTDIFEQNITHALKRYPEVTSFSFVGGVACNHYMKERFSQLAQKYNKKFFSSPPRFSTDNGGMIAFVGSYKATQNKFSDLSLDILDKPNNK